MYEFRHFYIPEHMMEPIKRYVENGIIPGGFLQAVICNNLHDALNRADDETLRNLPAYMAYFYNKTPMGCWGSKKKMMDWQKGFKNEKEDS